MIFLDGSLNWITAEWYHFKHEIFSPQYKPLKKCCFNVWRGYTVLRGTLYRTDCNSILYTRVKNKRISTRFHFENDNTTCIKADYKPLSILSLNIPEYTWILLNRLIAYRFKSHVLAIFTFLFNQECKLVPLSELSTTPNRERERGPIRIVPPCFETPHFGIFYAIFGIIRPF